MVQVTKVIEFDAAHRLGRGYPAMCKNIHGHRYKVHLTCECYKMDQFDMVIDFSKIKNLCKTWIDNNIDHATIVDDQDTDLIQFLEEQGNKHIVVPFITTVENLVPWLREKLQEQLMADEDLKDRDVYIKRLRIYETPNGWCEKEW